MKQFRYTRPGYTIRRMPVSPYVALIMLALTLGLAMSAKAAETKGKTVTSYIVNKKETNKVEAIMSLARDASAEVWECKKMYLDSSTARLKPVKK